MSSKIDSVSTIVASFPVPELTKYGDLSNKPTYHTLLAMQKELNTNAASVDTTQGTGIHGLLVLTMNASDFRAMTIPNINPAIDDYNPEAVDFPHPPPINPGNLPARATAADVREHEHNVYHHQIYHSTDKALKKILLAAGPDLYLSAIKDPRTGYATVTTLQMLHHLWTTYGIIKPEDLDANIIAMSKTWHPTSPIENLFLQIDEGIDFALAGESPIDDSTAVRIIYKIVADTGVFELPCREWRALPRHERTLANFKIRFRAANDDRSATTGTAGYHTLSANAATATSINENLTTLLAAHNKLQQQFEQLKARTNKYGTDATIATTNSTRPPPPFKGYCHTHGVTHCYKEANIHTSHNCNKPGPDHKKEATESNKMGGNDKIWTHKRPATNNN